MKNIIVIICIAASAITINSCKKDDEKKEYTIRGRVIQSCQDSTPLANLSLILQYSGGAGLSGNKVFDAGNATTNKDGYFTLTYKNIKQVTDYVNLIQNISFGQSIVLGGIPYNNDMNVGNIYLSSEIFLIYKLRTSGRQSSYLDTFFCKTGTINKIIIGPFYDNQVIDTITRYPIHLYGSLESTSSFYWRIGKTSQDIFNSTNYSLCNKYNDAIIDLSLAK